MSEIDRDEVELARRVAENYRRTPAPDAAERARLDRALTGLRPPRPAGWLARLLEPRLLRVRPGALAAAALAAVALGFVAGGLASRGREPGTTAADPPAELAGRSAAITVPFVLVVPGAAEVSLVGDFNHWNPEATPMTRLGAETWRADVRLAPGVHVYAFVVDGQQWVSDPLAPLAPANAFGFRNSVMVVGAPGAPS